MSIENNSADTVEDNLDAFSSTFFGQNVEDDSKQENETNSSEEETDDNDDVDATETDEDTNSEDDDTLDTEDDDEEDEEEAEEPAPKPKKSRFQERIDELTAKSREAERRANDLENKLLEAITKLNNKAIEDNPPASKAVVEDNSPKPEDKNEDGSDKYPLGEFDPGYIRDLTRHTIEQESKAVKEREERERAQNEQSQQEIALVQQWTTKLTSAAETYPDLLEKNDLLEDTFRDLDPAYGKYLAATIMSMDYGPDVLYYLGNNVDEAKNIVASGAAKATVALGRLEAKFASAAEEKQKAKPRVSKAPPPPPANKGSAMAVADVPLDTDNLDAFEKTFFSKKKKA